MELLSRDPALRAALFRLVDVAPAILRPARPRRAPRFSPGRGARAGSAGLVPSARERDGARRGRAGARAARPSARSRASPCTGWRRASSSARTRPTPCPRSPGLWESGPPRPSTCSARRPSPPPRPTATRGAATRRCARWPRPRARWPARPTLDVVPRVNLSVKVTALTAKVKARGARARHRGRPPAARARCCARRKEVGAHLHVDMESLDSRELITQLVLDLLYQPEFAARARAPASSCRPTCATADEQLDQLLDWTGPPRAAVHDPPRQGRLLGARDGRGARRTAGRSPVVTEQTVECDRSFERAHAAADRRAGPHGPGGHRQPQPALDRPRRSPIPRRPHRRPRAPGPARPRRRPAGRAHRPRACACAPTARWATSWRAWPTSCAACWRTPSNDSFLAQPHASGTDLDQLLEAVNALHQRTAPRAAPRPRARRALTEALAALDAQLPLARADARSAASAATSRVFSSHRPRRRPRASSPTATARHRARGRPTPSTAAERRPRSEWQARARTPRAADRSRAPPVSLRGAAALLAALAVRECGKPWAEADGDVCEAIDFLEYYAQQARSRSTAADRLIQMPGERNTLRYVAARRRRRDRAVELPAGDRRRHGRRRRSRPATRVVLKPAEQAPACAKAVVDALPRRPASRPTRSSLLPGGGDAGRGARRPPARPHDRLHRLLRRRAWRSSRPPPTLAPGQRHLKRVVAEMGGKNCVIVDADADLDDVVPALVYSPRSAFAGQKCSRRLPRARARTRSPTTLAERLAGAVEHAAASAPPQRLRHRRPAA